MKTQLLEDIGHSASLSLVPSSRDADFRSHIGAQTITQAPVAKVVKPRPLTGVWKARPAGVPVDFATQQQDQPPPPVEILPVVEPIAAADALETPSAQADEAYIAPPEPAPAPIVVQSEPAPPVPVFDFAPSSPVLVVADPFTQEATWLKRSGRRYLVWGACALSVALVAQAGVWLYGERKEARALALVAAVSKAQTQADNAAKRRITAAKEFTLSPEGEVRVTPATPAATPAPVPSPSPTPPPSLVLLEPDPVPAIKVEPAVTRVADPVPPQTSPKPRRALAQAPAAPLPKQRRETARAQLEAAAKPARPARTRADRMRDRQLARASLTQVEAKPNLPSPMEATQKACKDYGYTPAQCVKRACSMTKYGFVCRGK